MARSRRKPASAPAQALASGRAPVSSDAVAPTRPSPVPSREPGIRVLCVDDHELLVEGLKAQFAIDGSISVVGWLATTDGMLDAVATLKPDLVLLDIELPGPDVFETADRLRRLHPGLRVVFLSAHVRDGYLAAAFNAGAWGYFAKGDRLQDIVDGIRTLARCTAGDFIMGPKVRERCSLGAGPPARTATRLAAPRRATVPATPLASLSAREIEVLRLIGRGLSRGAIAAELSRSPKTIDGHQERIMKKLSLTSRAELMRFAIREGLAEA